MVSPEALKLNEILRNAPKAVDMDLLYLYGGGYVISSPHSRRKLASHLAKAAGTRTLVPMIRAGVRSRTSRENGGAAKNKEEDVVSASGQASEEASPTYTGRPTFDNGGHVHPKA